MSEVINGMQRELKPCPFCNGQVSFHQDDECSGCHLIHCAKCDAFFDFATGADPENEAAELCELCALCACAWNHRTLLATAQPADHSEHALNMAAKPAADGEREVWAVPVLDGEKKTTFYTEQLPFVPGRGVKQLGEPVRMVETKHVGAGGLCAAFIAAAKPYYSEFEWDWGQNRFYDDHVQRAWRLWQAGYYAITTKEL